MAGSSLVRLLYWASLQSFAFDAHAQFPLAANYDVTKLHYEGPGDVPGATGGPYGYDIRTSTAA